MAYYEAGFQPGAFQLDAFQAGVVLFVPKARLTARAGILRAATGRAGAVFTLQEMESASAFGRVDASYVWRDDPGTDISTDIWSEDSSLT